jgi:hypothetical protein
MRPTSTETIVDVGVSDVLNRGANLLERKYPYPQHITACGLGEAIEFQHTFPAVRYIRIQPNVPLPFPDQTFDIAFSNAVLEHVGSEVAQRDFVKELCRIGRRVFITVPHRYFPIEHHTAIPVAHYWDFSFTLACTILRKTEWARKESLTLISRKQLRSLTPQGMLAVVGYTGIRLGIFSSNLYIALKPL